MSPHLVKLMLGSQKVIMRSWRWLIMGLNFSVVYAAVGTVTWFRVLEALLAVVKLIV